MKERLMCENRLYNAKGRLFPPSMILTEATPTTTQTLRNSQSIIISSELEMQERRSILVHRQTIEAAGAIKLWN